ncbi:hypothetical protein [Lawsonibacter faecis]|uniref:Transmembrane protein n=1 Tax=Lawsonibacter faecis TaxID=2763052 RepID=A0A8J6JJB8_9FIRM|nr:hypothetical protein [Lawsonibacter faecis]MBC5736314.1 hypothetical protein [Lawsonibacter faecis]
MDDFYIDFDRVGLEMEALTLDLWGYWAARYGELLGGVLVVLVFLLTVAHMDGSLPWDKGSYILTGAAFAGWLATVLLARRRRNRVLERAERLMGEWTEEAKRAYCCLLWKLAVLLLTGHRRRRYSPR